MAYNGLSCLKSLMFLRSCVVRWWPHETILLSDETISRFRADIRKHQMVITPVTKRRAAPELASGDSQMRNLSFLLAFAFLLAGPSMAGSTDSGLPGVGTFAYSGSPVAASAPQTVVVAAR
jgi:hypothetical protein